MNRIHHFRIVHNIRSPPPPNFVVINFSWDDYNFENTKHVCKIWGGGYKQSVFSGQFESAC